MNAANLTLQLKNDLEELESLTAGVETFCGLHGFHPRDNFEMTLVLDEIFTNIISYGFRDDEEHIIRIDLAREEDRIIIRVEDDGAPFDPTKATDEKKTCSLEKCRIGGLGLHLINRIMSRVKYKRKKGRNILVLEKRLAEG